MKKKKYILPLIALLSVVLVTCIDEHVLPNFGHVFITSDPPGAAIFKNGEDTEKITPANFDELLSGNYTFTLQLDSFVDTTFTIEVNEGEKYTQDIFLTEENPLGKIILKSEPAGADIYLDGIFTGNTTPDTLEHLQRGEYNFTLKLNLYEDFDVKILLNQNESITRNIEMVVAGTAGSIYITTTPPGANIELDGEYTGFVTPATLNPLSPGEHAILLSLENYRDTTIVSNVVSGEVTTEEVVLTVYEPRGSITLDSNPQGALIFLDNNNTGLYTPSKIEKLEAGEYNIRLSLDAYYDTTFVVTVIEDQNTTVPVVNLEKIPLYEIKASSVPAGASNIDGAGTYRHGDEVTLTTTANPGYVFINWTENGTEVYSDPVYTFIAERDRELAANYAEIGNLKVNSDPEGADIYFSGEPTGEQTPHTFENLLAGQYIVELKLEDFADTSVTVLVNRNQTTDLGTIYLRDIVPAVQVTTLTYRVETNGQLIFSFSFNQAVYLDRVEIRKPDGSNLPPQNYYGQLYPQGFVIDLPFPEKIDGSWRFSFFGNKAGGRQASFNVVKNLNVN